MCCILQLRSLALLRPLYQARPYEPKISGKIEEERCEQALVLDSTNNAAAAQLEKMKREKAAQANVIRPTYPAQHFGLVPGSPLFK